MARSVVKELVVKILGDDTELGKAAGRSEAAIRRIGARAAEVGKALVTAGAAGGAALGAIVGRSIAVADEAGKTAASIGTTVETLTALRHAANLSDVSNEQLETGLGRLARAASDAAAGSATSGQAFKALGVSVTDTEGRLRPQRELLGDLADRFAAMEDGTRKTALAQEIFGRSGAQLIPLLNEGSAGLATMTAEAERMGLVISGDTAAAAAQFQDNLTRLKAALTGAVNLVAQRVLPILVDLSNRFVDASGKTGGFKNAIDAAEQTLRGAIATGALFKGVIQTVGETLGSVAAAAYLAIRGRFGAAVEALKTTVSDASANFHQTIDSVVAAWEDLGKNLQARAPELGAQIAAPAVEAGRQVKTASEKMAEDLKGLVASFEEERDTVGLSVEALTRYRLAKLGADEATIAHVLSLREETTLLRLADEEYADLIKRGQGVTEQFRTAQEIFAARQAELNELLATGAITAGTYGRAMEEAKTHLAEATAGSEEFSTVFARMLDRATAAGKLSFKSFADSVIEELKRILVQAVITQTAMSFLAPGAGGGGIIGGIIGGIGNFLGLEHGGPVERGRGYLVGERGPELFVPREPGRIVPGNVMAPLGPATGQMITLRLDQRSLPPRPRIFTPDAVATDDWWRRAFSALVADAKWNGVRFD